jgi:hypothetical protein
MTSQMTTNTIQAHLLEENAALRKAISECQSILLDLIVPDSVMSDRTAVSLLLGVLDNKDIVKLMKGNV